MYIFSKQTHNQQEPQISTCLAEDFTTARKTSEYLTKDTTSHSRRGAVTTARQQKSRSSLPGVSRYFSLHQHVQTNFEPHPIFYPMNTGGNTLASSKGVKWPGREAHHLPPSNAEVKNARSFTSTTAYVFVVW
jgi:hypothetical protein